MARVVGRQMNARRTRRATDWSLGLIAAGKTSVAANSKVLVASLSEASLLPIAPATVVRTRGAVQISSDQSAADEDQIGSIGVAFVSEVARALGVTAIPGPSTETLWDGWFVHQFFQQRFLFASNTGEHLGLRQYEIDSKAMRKFEGAQGLVFMCENTGSFGFEIMWQMRFLVKAG